MDDPAGLKEQLGPLEAALLANARRDAEARLEEARAHAARIHGDAEARAAEILSRARSEGAAAADRQGAQRRIEATREARGRVLQAQRAAYAALSEEVLNALPVGSDRPEYVALQDRLARMATALLGGEAAIERNPAGHGGVLAQLDGRRVDLTLPALVRRCIALQGKEVSRLWE